VKGADFVFRAEAVAYGPKIAIWEAVPAFQWLCVRVIEVLKGDLAEQEFRLLGDTGTLCRRYVTEQAFPLGAQFIFALRGPPEGPTEISSCGERVRLFDPMDQLVIGGRYSSMTYDEVKMLAQGTSKD
jgi:hypothetical protein